MQVKDAKCIMVVGRRGSGKTTKVKQLIAGRRRVIVFDPRDEYGHEGAARFEKLEPFRRHLAAWWGAGFRAAFVPQAGYEPEALDLLVRFLWQCQAPYEAGQDDEKLTLVVEEMDLSFPVRELPRELGGMRQVCNQGRHVGLEVIGVTQRPAGISSVFKGNAAETYIFPLAWPADQDAILPMIGRDRRPELAGLAEHHYIRIANGVIEQGANPPLRS